jgi:hypothetical protein
MYSCVFVSTTPDLAPYPVSSVEDLSPPWSVKTVKKFKRLIGFHSRLWVFLIGFSILHEFSWWASIGMKKICGRYKDTVPIECVRLSDSCQASVQLPLFGLNKCFFAGWYHTKSRGRYVKHWSWHILMMIITKSHLPLTVTCPQRTITCNFLRSYVYISISILGSLTHFSFLI